MIKTFAEKYIFHLSCIFSNTQKYFFQLSRYRKSQKYDLYIIFCEKYFQNMCMF